MAYKIKTALNFSNQLIIMIIHTLTHYVFKMDKAAWKCNIDKYGAGSTKDQTAGSLF